VLYTVTNHGLDWLWEWLGAIGYIACSIGLLFLADELAWRHRHRR
jgi:hypothetical protein